MMEPLLKERKALETRMESPRKNRCIIGLPIQRSHAEQLESQIYERFQTEIESVWVDNDAPGSFTVHFTPTTEPNKTLRTEIALFALSEVR